MDTNIELKSKLDLISQADEKANKIEEKINMQMKEIEKTKAVIDRFQECLTEQNKMLQRLFEDRKVIINKKSQLISVISNLDMNINNVETNSTTNALNCFLIDDTNQNGTPQVNPSDPSDTISQNLNDISNAFANREIVPAEGGSTGNLKRKHQGKENNAVAKKPCPNNADESATKENLNPIFQYQDDVTIKIIIKHNDSIFIGGSRGFLIGLEKDTNAVTTYKGIENGVVNVSFIGDIMVAITFHSVFFFHSQENVVTKKFASQISNVSIRSGMAYIALLKGKIWAYNTDSKEFVLYGNVNGKINSFICLSYRFLFVNKKKKSCYEIGSSRSLNSNFDKAKSFETGPRNTFFCLLKCELILADCNSLRVIRKQKFEKSIVSIAHNDRKLLVQDTENVIHIFDIKENFEFRFVRTWTPTSEKITALAISLSDEVFLAYQRRIFRTQI